MFVVPVSLLESIRQHANGLLNLLGSLPLITMQPYRLQLAYLGISFDTTRNMS